MRTVCVKGGHDLTDPANVLQKTDGTRQCYPCHLKAANVHYHRKGAPPDYPQLPKGQTTCVVEGCDRPRKRAGANGGLARYCGAHQQRLASWGDVFEDVPLNYKKNQSLPDSRAELAG